MKTIMKTPFRLTQNQRRSAAAFMLACFVPTVALGLPVAPQVINGTATFSTNGNAMTVTNSANAIINWQGFSIGRGESTRFIQPSANSAVLNRITGGDPSKIFGTLQSNGKVLLINPNGILFGSGARVDVNGLFASTLNITNEDFLAGRMKFTAGAVAGTVENQGIITTPGGGGVYLIAPDVTNSGIITAPNGDVLLAAGKEVLLVDKNNPEIALVVSAPEHQAINLGTLVAKAGRVGMYGGVVRQKGVISANSAVKDANGRIFLKATDEVTVEAGSLTTANGPGGGNITVQSTEGTTLVSGSIEAKGSNGIGGTVQILGYHAGLLGNAVVDASGQTGGGTVLVGGDYQGKNPVIQNAQATYIGEGTTIKADATNNGNGGKVIVWADDTTRAYGSISAEGGLNGGNGGFVETSGHNYLDFQGRVNTAAPRGTAGTLLLDPADITIDNSTTSFFNTGPPVNGILSGGVFYNAQLNSTITWATINGQTGAVEIRTNSAGAGGLGDINITASGSITGPATLTLLANNNINIANGVSISGGSSNINLIAGWNNTGWAVTPGTGNVTFNTGSNLSTTGILYANVGNNFNQLSGSTITVPSINLTAANSISLAGTNSINNITVAQSNSSGGDISISSAPITGALNLASVTNSASTGNIFVNSSGKDINIIGPVSVSGNLSLSSGGNVTQSGGAITAAGLELLGSGTFSLTGSNSISTVAASISGAGPITLNNTGNLNIGTVGGTTGISGASMVSLHTAGALTQSAGALLGSTSLNVEGAFVALNEANPVGVISGKATAGSFQYKSSNAIFVTTVNGTSGIQNTGSGGDIVLTGNGIGQNALLSTSSVAGGGGFALTLTSSGAVTLQNAGNNVTSITGNLSGGSGSLSFMNGGNLSVGSVFTNGNYVDLQVPVTSLITVNGSVNTGTGANSIFKLYGGGITYNNAAVTNSEHIFFQSTSQAQGITLNGGVVGTSNTKSINLFTDKLTLAGGTALVGNSPNNSIEISPFTANTPIVVGTGTTAGTLYITDTSFATFNSPDFVVGSKIGDLFQPASGAIAVNAAISRAGGRVALLSGAGITQSAAVTASDLGVIAGGPVSLNSPNQITNLAIETSTGAIDFSNSGALNIVSMIGGIQNPTTITGLRSVAGGNIAVSASAGNISLGAPIVTDTTSSIVKLQASGGSIVDANSTGISITAKGLDVSAYSGIGTIAAPLKTQVTYLKAVNSMGGDISILNTGALITDAATPVSNSLGKISITAQSPLTIGAAGVSAGSDIILTAGGPIWVNGKTGDDLTINGPVKSSNGNILLTAGNGITGAGVITAPNGSVTKTANLNTPSAAPPLPTVTQCTADPTLPGCTTVLPALATCLATPTAPGCSVVLPGATLVGTETTGPINQIVNSLTVVPITPVAPPGLQLVAAVADDKQSDSKDNGKDKDESGSNQQQSQGGDKKDGKAKKNYCN